MGRGCLAAGASLIVTAAFRSRSLNRVVPPGCVCQSPKYSIDPSTLQTSATWVACQSASGVKPYLECWASGPGPTATVTFARTWLACPRRMPPVSRGQVRQAAYWRCDSTRAGMCRDPRAPPRKDCTVGNPDGAKGQRCSMRGGSADRLDSESGPVSYTHLTLPTNREV